MHHEPNHTKSSPPLITPFQFRCGHRTEPPTRPEMGPYQLELDRVDLPNIRLATTLGKKKTPPRCLADAGRIYPASGPSRARSTERVVIYEGRSVLEGAVSLLGLCRCLLSYIVPFCLGAWHAVAINEFITRVLIRGYHRWVTEATTPMYNIARDMKWSGTEGAGGECARL